MSLATWKVRAILSAAIVISFGLVPETMGQIPGGNTSSPGGATGGIAPTIVSISAVQVAGRKFRIYGQVSDDTPANCGVVVSGAANGVALCDSNGNFSAVFSVPTPGKIQAVAGDGTLESAAREMTLSNSPPTVAGFTAVKGTGNAWTFSGSVTDEVPGGLSVGLKGPPGVDGTTATVLANGSWSVTVTVAPNTSGFVTATATDWYAATGSATTFFGP